MTAPHAGDMDIIIEHLRQYCPDMRVYMDIGAGDGYDCGLVERAFPDCRCIAIEPMEPWHPQAPEERYRMLVSYTGGYRPYFRKVAEGVSGMYERIAGQTVSCIERPSMTMADLCYFLGVGTVDAMKIDVEGASHEVLCGMHSLQDLKVVHVETEWIELFRGQVLEDSVFRVLSTAGLTKVWENRVEDLGQGDSIWVRK